MPEKNSNIKILLLVGALIISCLLSLFYGGSEHISDLSFNNFIFWHIRFPKTITAIIAGCTLSVAGLILQIIFRNPLAGPYVLGISSGASLMVALSILAGSSLHLLSDFFIGKAVIVASAITGSFLITLLILAIAKKVNSNVVLLLIGLMLSQVCGALQTALEYFSDANSLKSFVIWGMGSLSNTTNLDLAIYLPIALVFLVAVVFFIKPLNALLLGENYAQNIGVNFKSSRFYLILFSSVLTGVTTAFCGPIAFIGISVPILSRMLFKNSKQQFHLTACLLLGSILLLLSDTIANSALKTSALPINMITTIIGAPLVIYLMFKNKSW
jgi:iron complex transport system permease protein